MKYTQKNVRNMNRKMSSPKRYKHKYPIANSENVHKLHINLSIKEKTFETYISSCRGLNFL